MSKPLKINPRNTIAEPTGPLFLCALDKVRYELPIFLFFLVFYPVQHFDIDYDVYSSLLAFDYRIGFAPRLLIGSLMSLFTDYKSIAFMHTFYIIFFLLSALLFAFVAGRLIRGVSGKTREITVIFILLFLAVPYSFTALYPRSVSVDRFMIVFTLLSLILISKKGFKWLVPLLLAMGLATYAGFAFMYMPAIAIVLLYETYKEKPSAGGKVLFLLSFLVMAVFSAYFLLYDGVKTYTDVDSLLAYATSKTDLFYSNFFRAAVEGFLLTTPEDFFLNDVVPLDGYKGFYHEFTSTLFLLPLYTIFFLVWQRSIKSSQNKVEKFIFILCLLAPVARLPMFIVSTNYFRSRIALVIVQFFLVLYFIHRKNQTVTEVVKRIGLFFTNHVFLLLIMIAYYALHFLALDTGSIYSKIINAMVGTP